MNTFICYEKCSTCRKAEKWLNANGIAFEKRPIKEQNPNEEELKQWIAKSGRKTSKFFNTSGQLYRSMGLSAKLKDMSEEEMIQLLATDGMLVKRPIFITGDRVLVGFREEEWKEALL